MAKAKSSETVVREFVSDMASSGEFDGVDVEEADGGFKRWRKGFAGKLVGDVLGDVVQDGDLVAEVIAEEAAGSGDLRTLPLHAVHVSTFNPRKEFEPEELQELANSIAQYGLLEPIVVRPDGGDGFEIVAGERRYRAHRLAGLTSITAIVRSVDDKTASVHALLENLQRRDLSAVEEARGYAALRETHGMTVEAISAAVHRSRPAVSNAMRLLELPEGVLSMVGSGDGKLSVAHARALLRWAAFPDAVAKMAAVVIENGVASRELEAERPRYDLFDSFRKAGIGAVIEYSDRFHGTACMQCPYAAHLAYQEFQPGLCLKPEHLAELRASQKASDELAAGKALEKQAAEKAKVYEASRAALSGTKGAARAEAQAVHDRAQRVAQKTAGGLPELGKMSYDAYHVHRGERPAGCSEDCVCNVVALERGSAVNACLEPSRYRSLVGRDTKDRNRAAREKVAEQRRAIEVAVHNGGAGSSPCALAVVCLAALDGVSDKVRKRVGELMLDRHVGCQLLLLNALSTGRYEGGTSEKLRRVLAGVPVETMVSVTAMCLIEEELEAAYANGNPLGSKRGAFFLEGWDTAKVSFEPNPIFEPAGTLADVGDVGSGNAEAEGGGSSAVPVTGDGTTCDVPGCGARATTKSVAAGAARCKDHPDVPGVDWGSGESVSVETAVCADDDIEPLLCQECGAPIADGQMTGNYRTDQNGLRVYASGVIETPLMNVYCCACGSKPSFLLCSVCGEKASGPGGTCVPCSGKPGDVDPRICNL